MKNLNKKSLKKVTGGRAGGNGPSYQELLCKCLGEGAGFANPGEVVAHINGLTEDVLSGLEKKLSLGEGAPEGFDLGSPGWQKYIMPYLKDCFSRGRGEIIELIEV